VPVSVQGCRQLPPADVLEKIIIEEIFVKNKEGLLSNLLNKAGVKLSD
jgi:hypothetical protein